MSFSEFTKEEYKKYAGSFPGPANNFFIVDLYDYWHDPDESEKYTNVFLRDDLKENSDFIYLNLPIWSKINEYFTSNYQIERRLIKMPDMNFIEVYLKKIEILVLSSILINSDLKQYIKPRYIQISKTKTVLDLKNKILRCIKKIIKANSLILNKSYDIKVYVPDLVENRKKILFELIYSYTNKFMNFKIKGEEVQDDNMTIEV